MQATISFIVAFFGGIKMKKLMKNTIYFRLFEDSFFDKYEQMDEFLKKNTRGHGVLLVNYLDLLVAVPLRSSLNPNIRKQRYIFPYEVWTKKDGKKYLKAMDFSKLIIVSKGDLRKSIGFVFRDNEEKKYYQENYNKIMMRLTKYITDYVTLYHKIDKGEQVSFRKLKMYRYSTIRNFHSELKINISKQDFIEILKNHNLY